MIRILRALMLVALVCIAPAIASAQQVPDWTTNVKLGRPLYITLLSGERLEGIAGSVTPDGVSVATPNGVKTAHYSDVRRVQKRDGPWNGILIGTAVGTALGIAAMVDNNGCDAYGFSESCGEGDGYFVVTGALYGGLIGWGVDTLIKGRSTLFDNAGATKISFAGGPHGVSGRVSLRW
ncbi:MAG: hypothetical protein ABIS06_02510 [Vicinamibacterales bacterium]